jgi:sterol desaturase/sphingolipid hydroxylase (fatty acid hydroxylase superfamily)
MENSFEKTGHKYKGSGKAFKSELLNRLTKTHISIPLTILFGSATGLILYAAMNFQVNWMIMIGLFLLGFILFTLAEYLIHRYFYHIEPSTEFKAKLQYIIHGVHHQFPNDKERLALPPVLTVFLAATFFFVIHLFVGVFAFGFVAGFLVGYASYLSVHYAVHAFRPPKNNLKILWSHHSLHHYKYPERAFGVSSPLWDVIFRTMPPKKG